MKLSTFNEIVELIHAHSNRECLRVIAELYPTVSIRTLGSIYSQEYQKKTKKCHHRLHTAKSKERIYQKYVDALKERSGDHILLKISDEIGLSPSILGRMVLEFHLLHTTYAGEATVPKPVISNMLKDTALIEDPVLAHEIQACVLADDVYGPLVDTIKHAIGQEHEILLQRKLESLGLAYLDEDQMRARGYDKTPDFKLEVPIAVDGHVVNWVESKASFGDEDSHKTYLKEQFWSYWNRFGPGLVIYWFGFIDELDLNRDKGIILMDHFPDNIVKMNPGLLAHR